LGFNELGDDPNNLTAEHAEDAEFNIQKAKKIIWWCRNFILGVLCGLCGEKLKN